MTLLWNYWLDNTKTQVALSTNPDAPPVAPPVELEDEELEAVIAPGRSWNHNETQLPPPTELEAEELEVVIAPGFTINHNETFQ